MSQEKRSSSRKSSRRAYRDAASLKGRGILREALEAADRVVEEAQEDIARAARRVGAHTGNHHLGRSPVRPVRLRVARDADRGDGGADAPAHQLAGDRRPVAVLMRRTMKDLPFAHPDGAGGLPNAIPSGIRWSRSPGACPRAGLTHGFVYRRIPVEGLDAAEWWAEACSHPECEVARLVRRGSPDPVAYLTVKRRAARAFVFPRITAAGWLEPEGAPPAVVKDRFTTAAPAPKPAPVPKPTIEKRSPGRSRPITRAAAVSGLFS